MVWLIWAVRIIGGAMVIGAAVVVVRALFADRSRGRRRCPKCWYDMAGVRGLRCPECGREARNEHRLLRTRRRPRRVALGLLLGFLAVVTWRVPGAIKNGWWSEVPTPLLVVMLQFWDDDAVFQRVQGRMGTSPNSLTGWEKLLLARHCAKVLAKPDATVTPAPGSPSPAMSPADLTVFPTGWPTPSRSHAQALQLLAALGSHARPAVSVLIACLDNPAERGEALAILAGIGPEARSAIGPVVALAADASYRNHARVFATLHALHATTDAAMAAARTVATKEQDLSVKLTATRFIATTFPAQRAIPALTRLLTAPELATRIAAARGLEKLGAAATPAVSALAHATRDPACPLEAVGVNVLSAIRTDQAIAALGDLAVDPNPEVARPAASALGGIGSRAAAAVPALVRALSHHDPFVPPHAANSLGLIGTEEARRALETLAATPQAPGGPEAGRALAYMRLVAEAESKRKGS